MALSLHDLDLERECVVIKNTSSEGVSLEDCIFQDAGGKNSCKPFGDYIIAPTSSVVFWTCPGKHGKVDDDKDNLLWRNKNGKPRSKAVLNNEGDGLQLLRHGTVWASIQAEPGNDGADVTSTSGLPDVIPDATSTGRSKRTSKAATRTETGSTVSGDSDTSEGDGNVGNDDDAAGNNDEALDGNADKDDNADSDASDGPEDDEDLDALVTAAFDRVAVALDNDIMRPLSSALLMPTSKSLGLVRGQPIQTQVDAQLEAIMQSSVLSKTSRKQLGLAETDLSKHKQKGIKRSSVKTAGSQWFDMQSTQITPEIAADLKLLKMRDVLDRKRHYKSADGKGLPTHFQIGRVVDGAAEYYSDRATKKQAKQTLVDELLADTEKRKYNKTKYVQLVANKYTRSKRPSGNAAAGFKSKKAKHLKKPF